MIGDASGWGVSWWLGGDWWVGFGAGGGLVEGGCFCCREGLA